tara:strand:- start:22 stop:309 length:288 start_codon:yes stop_codon:yes gene_type:complete
MLSPYANLIIAVEAPAAGKVIKKSPADAVISPPKSNTHTAGFVRDIDVVLGVELYINAPLAVTDTLENVKLAKSHTAVVLDNAGSIEVKFDPPEE